MQQATLLNLTQHRSFAWMIFRMNYLCVVFFKREAFQEYTHNKTKLNSMKQSFVNRTVIDKTKSLLYKKLVSQDQFTKNKAWDRYSNGNISPWSMKMCVLLCLKCDQDSWANLKEENQ